MRISASRATVNNGQRPDFNPDAIHNTTFYISGSIDAFVRPPVSDYTLKNLYYIQDFDIFHYDFDSYTIREGFDSFLLAYTYGGSGHLSYEGKDYDLTAGDCFFIDCMKYHKYEAIGQNWDCGILHLNGALLRDFYEMYLQVADPVFHEEFDGKLQKYIESILRTYQIPQIYRDWQVSGYIVQLLNHIIIIASGKSEAKTVPDNIKYLMKYMENNYNQPLTLDFLASFSNMSKYYLSREFKKFTGFSPNEYIISLRIDRAKILLESTNLPVYEIAHQVGIHDINNFTKLFKKKVGQTPIQYRKTAYI